MSLYHEDKEISQFTVEELYDTKVRLLEEEMEKLKSIIEKMQKDGVNGINKNSRIKDLIEYAKSQVVFEEVGGEKSCPYCCQSDSGCCATVKVGKDKIIYGIECRFDLTGCKGFHAIGEIPLLKDLDRSSTNDID